jgi:tripartite-type tricarboxylate transporter receptor subunit TctC
MKTWHIARRSLLALSLAFGALPTLAQDSVLRIVVPYPAGGSSDRAARFLAEALGPRIKQTVVVENIVGAGGRLAMQQLKRSTVDANNTLVLVNPALMVIAPAVYSNNGYDAEADYQPVSQISSYEMAAAVGAAVPVREFNHLLAWLRANPEKANFGVPATGSLPHFFALMTAQAAGAKVPVIGYRGSAPLTQDLIGGHIPAVFDSIDALLPLHEGGRVRILATSGDKRLVPSIPTLKESGMNIVATGWNTLFAKTEMGKDRVALLAQEIATLMTQSDIRAKFTALKAEPVSASLAQTQRDLAAFKAQWVPVIQKSGLKLE